jgi:transposase InsO family protein
MSYAFMTAQAGEYSVQGMCRALGINRSGYYAWRERRESLCAQANQKLRVHIQEEYQASGKTYGSPRIHAALRRKGIVCTRKRVARLMRQAELVGRKAQKVRPRQTQSNREALPAPNLLNRDFSSPAPDRKWVTDMTYIPTAEGWLFLAVVLDLCSRRVVGWAMDERAETSLVQAAWQMAVAQRQPAPGLLHHSDQGSQYTSDTYQQALQSIPCQISMSRVANCYDNAAMESFFSTLKTECAHTQFASRAQARTTIFEYIEGWYNRQRLHSSLGYLSPAEFEAQFRD